jgi:hypothetical protein
LCVISGAFRCDSRDIRRYLGSHRRVPGGLRGCLGSHRGHLGGLRDIPLVHRLFPGHLGHHLGSLGGGLGGLRFHLCGLRCHLSGQRCIPLSPSFIKGVSVVAPSPTTRQYQGQ